MTCVLLNTNNFQNLWIYYTNYY